MKIRHTVYKTYVCIRTTLCFFPSFLPLYFPSGFEVIPCNIPFSSLAFSHPVSLIFYFLPLFSFFTLVMVSFFFSRLLCSLFIFFQSSFRLFLHSVLYVLLLDLFPNLNFSSFFLSISSLFVRFFNDDLK